MYFSEVFSDYRFPLRIRVSYVTERMHFLNLKYVPMPESLSQVFADFRFPFRIRFYCMTERIHFLNLKCVRKSESISQRFFKTFVNL